MHTAHDLYYIYFVVPALMGYLFDQKIDAKVQEPKQYGS